jgi:hypothetical protein
VITAHTGFSRFSLAGGALWHSAQGDTGVAPFQRQWWQCHAFMPNMCHSHSRAGVPACRVQSVFCMLKAIMLMRSMYIHDCGSLVLSSVLPKQLCTSHMATGGADKAGAHGHLALRPRLHRVYIQCVLMFAQ